MTAIRGAVLVLSLLLPAAARADGMSAKEHFKKGVSYYALGKYAEAASEYEAAFEMQPDPALLYNAAQAHRLGGNKQRALVLYQSFLRMFPQKDDGTVAKHIIALKAAIEAEGNAANQPPTSPRQMEPKPETPEPKPVTPPVVQQVVVAQPPPPPPKKRTPGWVWGVVAGAVVVVGVGVGVGLGVGLSGSQYPSASVGGATVP